MENVKRELRNYKEKPKKEFDKKENSPSEL
jgi:hypothetical protein